MKILVISHLYPDATRSHFGIFIQREVESLLDHCRLKVIAPRPWIPWKNSKKKAMGNGQVEVSYLCYFPLPGALFRPVKGLWLFLFLKRLVYRIKKRFDFDIIHAHMVYPTGFCTVLLKRIFKKPVVISIRGADINKLPRYYFLRKMIVYTLNNADAVITVSNSLKQRILDLGIPENKVKVMAKGVDLDKFKPMDKSEARKKLNLPQDKIIVLSVGHLISRKNPLGLVESVCLIPEDKRGSFLFVWVGEGQLEKKMREKIKENKLEDMFLLAGRVDPDFMPEWLNTADIFVLISFSEGMPNVLYEAFACGIPAIVSGVDGALEIIKNGENGILVSPHDSRQISEQILSLARGQDLRDNLSRNARIYMEDKGLSWDKNAFWITDIYKEILNSN